MIVESIIQSIMEMNKVSETHQGDFLNPDYDSISDTYKSFDGIEYAVERIKKAISNKERILIWGDFDVDGLTATSIMFRTLTFLGATPTWHIPDRRTQGHGLNRKNIERLCSEQDLMVTVDCGIQNHQEIKYAQYLGCETILTDHHTPEEIIPDASVILTPPTSLATDFSGAGIAFKLAQALLSDTDEGKKICQNLLWLACLGTIVDCVEQRNENRVISVLGLRQLNEDTPACIRALALETKMNRPVNKSQISWKLAPIINSASRLGYANVAAEILIEPESNRNKILNLSKRLGQINKQRKETFDYYLNKCFSIEDYFIRNRNKFISVVFDLDKKTDSRGIAGILAARLSTMYEKKPSFVFTDIGEGVLVGSARCPNHNFSEIISNISHLIISGGGHQNVGGLSMYAENFKEFQDTLNDLIPTVVEEEKSLEKSIELPLSEVSLELYNSLSVLEPYEHGDSPLFQIKGVIHEGFQLMGKEDQHAKFEITDGKNYCQVLAWNQGKEIIEIINSNKNLIPEVIVQGRLKPNNWNGITEIQIEAQSVSLGEE